MCTVFTIRTICTVFTIRTIYTVFTVRTICTVCALFIYRVAFYCNLFIGVAFYRNLLLGAAILLQNVRFTQIAIDHIHLPQTATTSPKKNFLMLLRGMYPFHSLMRPYYISSLALYSPF